MNKFIFSLVDVFRNKMLKRMENSDITEQLEYQGNREKLLKNPILKLIMFQNNVIPIQGVSEFLSLTCKKNTVLKDDKSMIPVAVFQS